MSAIVPIVDEHGRVWQVSADGDGLLVSLWVGEGAEHGLEVSISGDVVHRLLDPA